jgi:1-acyl-sn-glycerol-3-phosphate acyltransferase
MLSWLSYLWYEVAYFASYWAGTLGFSLRTEGGSNIPAAGPVLVIANHQSVLDPVLVGLSTRRHLQSVARKTLYRHRLFARLINSLNAIPIDLEGVGKEGIRQILRELEKGQAILLFPEGTRTIDGKVHQLRPGIHLLLRRAQAPIVPVGIAGAFEAWPPRRAYPLPAPLFWPAKSPGVAVSVGKPLDGRRFASLGRDAALAELASELAKWSAKAERLRRKI